MTANWSSRPVDRSRIVGSIRAFMERNTCFIGRWIVHPDFQKRDIGSMLFTAIENRFPNAARFELFTGHLSVGPIRFYEKRGYTSFRKVRLNPRLTLVYFEKVVSPDL